MSRYALANRIPSFTGSYASLLDNPVINAVYVPIPTALRTEWCIKAAKAKKHVLAEKPFASEEAVAHILEACREAGVVFLDGTMWLHHVRTAAMKEDLAKISPLSSIMTSFCFRIEDMTDIRLRPELEPLGALGDLGWYNVKAILWAYNWDLPDHVKRYPLKHRRAIFDQSPISFCLQITC
jgi:predicted dehydrogenase